MKKDSLKYVFSIILYGTIGMFLRFIRYVKQKDFNSKAG